MKTESQEEFERRMYIDEPGKVPLYAFRKKFNFRINYGMADIQIDHLLDPKWGYDIDWDVFLPSKGINLQRGWIWTLQQKKELILSVLKGITIPPITVIQFKSEEYRNNKGRSLYRIIDGKQRLGTLISFVRGQFLIPAGDGKIAYEDLTKQAQREICGCVRANIAYEYEDAPISDEDKIAWFEMINFAGTPQDLEHLNKLKS